MRLATLLLLAFPAAAAAQIPARNVQVLAHVNEYAIPVSGLAYGYSACWSYVHSDGREYGAIGTSGGTAIYNLTNPALPYRVAFIPGPPSTWREIKQYRDWLYVVTEGTGDGRGLQIIRMTDPQAPVLAATITGPGLVAAHTVAVDTARALLILNGTRSDNGMGGFPFAGMQIYSLAAPESPALLSVWPPAGPYDATTYVHDSTPVGNRLYLASVYSGEVRVLDTTDPANPAVVHSWTYPGGYYTHNVWPDSLSSALYVTDEQNGQTMRVFDIQNVLAPALVTGITSNPKAIVHNAHVRGNELFLSNYTEGIRVLDLTDPFHPAEYGWADTYPGPSGGYGGVWEVCPYFPSGIVIASDMQSGLWVFQPVRSYGRLRVTVVDAATQQPLAGVRVRLTSQGDSLTTFADGIVQFAPSPGSHTVVADQFGWTTASASASVANGGAGDLTLALAQRPTTEVSGVLRDRTTMAGLADGEVTLAWTPLETKSGAAGDYHLHDVPADRYRITVHRPGYVPESFVREFGAAPVIEDYTLAPAARWDSLETAAGWTVGAAGDNAIAGVWLNAAPVGTGTPPPAAAHAIGGASATRLRRPGAGLAHDEPVDGAGLYGQVKPWFDRTPGAATRCFITGQAASNSVDPGTADLDGGRTTLTSPAFDATAVAEPVIGYWRWFHSLHLGTGQPDDNDWFAVFVSNDNGGSWVPVDTLRGMHNTWEEAGFRVSDYVTPTAQVRVRFVAADLGPGTTVEAAVDDVTLYQGALAVVGVPRAGGATLRLAAPWPNPARGTVRLALSAPANTPVSLAIVDVRGAVVRRLLERATGATHELLWDGHDQRGRPAAAGVYFAVARAGAHTSRVRLVRLP